MFEELDSCAEVGVRIRVEVMLHIPDEDGPVRLVVVDEDDEKMIELAFSPARAKACAFPIARVLSRSLSQKESYRVAEGLRTAAIKVWASRN
jgi:hypothetical protein